MNRYIYILTLGVLFALTACIKVDIDYDSNIVNTSSEGEIHVFGAVEDFEIKHVGTRAGGDEISDAFISEMTMFIFKANGDIIQGYRTRNATFDNDGNLIAANFDGCEKCSSAINIAKANPTFLVDTEDGIIASYEGEKQTLIYFDNFADDLGQDNDNDNIDNPSNNCQIYIVANAYHQLKDSLDVIKNLDDLKSFVLEIDNTLSMPKDDNGNYRGFPMIGTPTTAKFNLRKGGKNAESVANIPLKKLYSKVRFTLQVCANQVVSSQVPTFTITKAEVFNVPAKARLGRNLDAVSGRPIYGENSNDDYVNEIAGGSISSNNMSEFYQFTGSKPFEITTFNKTTTTHNPSVDQTDDRIEFGFYMPEHKVTPNTITYPSGMPESCYQYYKPKGVGATRDESGLVSLAKIATYVRIHGQYTDHNGQIKDVRYDIYLGQNEVNDFTVKRNQQLNNQLVITGLTNYYNAYEDTEDNISIDHRVAVDYKGFNLSMERTAILDSHFEVRPLDVELSPGSTMKITIPEGDRDWVAMESDAAVRANYDANVYISNEESKAVRKYFTTGLVSELNNTTGRGNGGTITLTHSGKGNKTETYRVWFYVDENPNVYDKLLGESTDKGGISSSPSDGSYKVYGKNDLNPMHRICPVEFKFYGTDNDNTNGGAATVTKKVTVNLQQWNLWRVWGGISGNRYYDIEHEEEYLNNYASDMEYGQTQDGMPWGLEGIQLSNRIQAYWTQKQIHSSNPIVQWLINVIDEYLLNVSGNALTMFKDSDKDPFYDFYLSRDKFSVDKMGSNVDADDYRRDYKGIEFNSEIATTLKASSDPKAKIDGIILTEDPQSAFAYCYHKNKRNSSGEVETQRWFLPAIDEIEDIALGAYEEFDEVFQNKEYWSCQPAYEYNSLIIHPYRKGGVLGLGNNYSDMSGYLTLEGEFFNDHLDRARSTSVYATSATDHTNIQSGLPTDTVSGMLSVDVYTNGGNRDGEVDPDYIHYNINYNSDIYTIGSFRGNSSRTEKCRIRAVYRSGIDTSKPAKQQ